MEQAIPLQQLEVSSPPFKEEETNPRKRKIPYLPVADAVAGEPLPHRYQLLTPPISTGTFGVIYHLYDSKLGIDVAMKTLKGGESKEDAQNLQKEAKALAALKHPAIIDVKDFIFVQGLPHAPDQKLPAILMEYINPETTLSRILDKRKLTNVEVVQLVKQLASAIDYLAHKGVSHCDLTRSNIFFDEKTGEAKLTDFGYATNVNTASDLFGPPNFISPEQAQGSRDLNPASDVFSLASLVYTCLTGEERFYDSTAGATNEKMDIGRRTIVNDGFVNPAKLKKIKESLLATGFKDYQINNVIRVLDKAQLKKPTQRYQTASEFAKELSKALLPERSNDLGKLNLIYS